MGCGMILTTRVNAPIMSLEDAKKHIEDLGFRAAPRAFRDANR